MKTVAGAALVLLVAVSAAAQGTRGMPTIAILSPANPAGTGVGESQMLDALRAGLRAQGYVEGRNVRFEIRYAEWESERLRPLAAELVRLKPDVLFTWTSSGALAAKQTTSTIPVVIGAAGDLVLIE